MNKAGIIYRIIESFVPEYTLPDLFAGQSPSKEFWETSRREEVLDLLRKFEYGYSPNPPLVEDLIFDVLSTKDALNGQAVRKEVRIYLTPKGRDGKSMLMLMYLPKNIPNAPMFVGLNFYGNQTICSDPEIRYSTSWVRNNHQFKIDANKPTEGSRGVRAERWPVDYILAQGFGLATIYYGDIVPDEPSLRAEGIQDDFDLSHIPEKQRWGAISAWSFGLSRALDYFHHDAKCDESKTIVIGHSRLGKTSLWTGAQDQRFAGAVSSCSGCGGAALSRRHFGETVKLINRGFPHWFSQSFRDFDEAESTLPFDQHFLIAMLAPRPVYIGSGRYDLWADPYGEFLSGVNASPVYKLYGLEGLVAPSFPGIETPIHSIIGHHVRNGGHNILLYDWQNYIAHAKKHLGL